MQYTTTIPYYTYTGVPFQKTTQNTLTYKNLICLQHKKKLLAGEASKAKILCLTVLLRSQADGPGLPHWRSFTPPSLPSVLPPTEIEMTDAQMTGPSVGVALAATCIWLTNCRDFVASSSFWCPSKVCLNNPLSIFFFVVFLCLAALRGSSQVFGPIPF